MTQAAARDTHIVLFRKAGRAGMTAVCRRIGLKGADAAKAQRPTMAQFANEAGVEATLFQLLGVAVIRARPDQVARIAGMDEVEAVLPNLRRTLPRPQHRPGESRLKARFEDTGALTWGLQAIGLPGEARLTGKGVRVAVLDSGIDLAHPDFRGRVAKRNTRSFVKGETIQDGNGHGSHVAGTLAGPTESAAGRRYGVAPGATLLVGKVLNNEGEGFDDQIVNAIQWAIEQKARIISMSLGSKRAVDEPYSRLYERIAERALQADPGTIIVAAAGNDSDRPAMTAPVGNPAACPSILAVAACDQDLAVARFSSAEMDGIGAVDLTGPGVNIYSAVPGGGYEAYAGTSMATPHIAGIAALWLERTPKMTASELWDRLKISARALGPAADFGAGLARVPVAQSGAAS
ncbi:MAG: S8 family serine peptidase [Parvibaculaceae bacterium]